MGKTKSQQQTIVGSRKARRKQERKAKSERNLFNSKSKAVNIIMPSSQPEKHKNNDKKQQSKKQKQKGNKRMIKKSEKDDRYAHIDPDTAAAMRADDKEIAMLEEKLNMGGKRKGKDRLYKEYARLEGFGDDFGDFLDDLDRIGSRVDKDGFKDMDMYMDEESDGSLVELDDDASDNDTAMGQGNDDFIGNATNEDSTLDEGSDIDDHGSEDSGDGDGDDDEDSDESDMSTSAKSSEQSVVSDNEDNMAFVYRPSVGEDIYGNKIDTEKADAVSKKYVPPHLRKKQVDGKPASTSSSALVSDARTLSLIKRKLNGMLNRLSEGTLDSVAKQLIQLYNESATNDVNICVEEKLKQACVNPVQILHSLIPIFCALLAAVHVHVGNDVGGHLLESLVTSYIQALDTARKTACSTSDTPLDDAGDGYSKEGPNLALILSFLYNFQVVHCTLMYNIIRDLIKSFREIDVELLLLILRTSGFQLRSDDPSALKDIVLLVQERALKGATDDSSDKDESGARFAGSARISYMIDAITDLKNNKKRKKDEGLLERTAKLRKFVGRMKSATPLGRASADSCMRITLQDILDIEAKGRWWKVGASFVGNQFHADEMDPVNGQRSSKVKPKGAKENKLLKLASKQHMNTDIRRSIFCILMGSSDCDDAFEKLVRLNLKGKQDREIVRVLVHCCGQEKTYNPFYAFVAIRVCEFQSNTKFTLQLSFWDMFKQFHEIKARKAANMAKLLSHLVRENILSFKVIAKALEMETLPENGVIFLTVFMSSIFENCDPIFVGQLFGGNAPIDEEGIASRESLSVFLLQYLKGHPSNVKNSQFRACYKAAVKVCEVDVFEPIQKR